MAIQVQKQAVKSVPAEAEAPDEQPQDVRNKKLDAETDAMLDELDVLLGEVGDEFALQFIQQGGE